LGNHIQSFAGNDNRTDIRVTLMQPFLSYVTSTKTTIAFNNSLFRAKEHDFNRA
jgi:hypothetical protein